VPKSAERIGLNGTVKNEIVAVGEVGGEALEGVPLRRK